MPQGNVVRTDDVHLRESKIAPATRSNVVKLEEWPANSSQADTWVDPDFFQQAQQGEDLGCQVMAATYWKTAFR